MIFIDACLGKETEYTPVWMMRQAGRYLPQYRALRATTSDFISFCRDSAKAAQATLQPIDELDVDAAIIFSDILVLPLEMGMDLSFKAGEGPVFAKPLSELKALDTLSGDRAVEKLSYVYEALKIARASLAPNKALIGFCGAPWTLATYMIEGRGSKTYEKSKKMLYSNPQLLHSILRKLTNALKDYVCEQIKAGANAIQIFDSWAGALEFSAYYEFAWSYIKEICAHIKKEHPNVPVIVFPKGIGGFITKLDGDFDVLGVGWECDIASVKNSLGAKYVLQGNLEPARLFDKMAIEDGVDEILGVMGGKRHIMNLGHGITPDVSVEHARHFINYTRSRSKELIKGKK